MLCSQYEPILKFSLLSMMACNWSVECDRTIIQVCREVLTEFQGEIFTPGFRKQKPQYPPNLDCQWEILAPPNYHIELEFVKFKLEYHRNCRMDRVEIHHDGQGFFLCGSGTPGTAQNITSASSILETYIGNIVLRKHRWLETEFGYNIPLGFPIIENTNNRLEKLLEYWKHNFSSETNIFCLQLHCFQYMTLCFQ